MRAEVFDPTSEDTHSAIELAEETVRLSPNDHRWHLVLARALARDDQTTRAEAEFKRAIELPPSYAECRWYYGNFLLRAGRSDDAVAEFKIAAANDTEYRAQVLSLMWDYSAHDPAVLESIAATASTTSHSSRVFLAAHGRGSDALRDWDRLTDEQKASRGEITRLIVEGLYSSTATSMHSNFLANSELTPPQKLKR